MTFESMERALEIAVQAIRERRDRTYVQGEAEYDAMVDAERAVREALLKVKGEPDGKEGQEGR